MWTITIFRIGYEGHCYMLCLIYSFFDRLVQFIDSYEPPLKGLQEDLNFVSPRIGEVICLSSSWNALLGTLILTLFILSNVGAKFCRFSQYLFSRCINRSSLGTGKVCGTFWVLFVCYKRHGNLWKMLMTAVLAVDNVWKVQRYLLKKSRNMWICILNVICVLKLYPSGIMWLISAAH